jgi:threonine synthase
MSFAPSSPQRKHQLRAALFSARFISHSRHFPPFPAIFRYSREAGWRHESIAPLRRVGQFQVLELFHGPTFAFKDVALQLLGHFFDLALRKRNARMTILGATSGDTGSAAIAAVKGRANIDCTMLFPLGRTSKIQELQMTSNTESNIHCLAVKDSVFDDCQAIVKACFNDSKFNAEMSLGAVNSINWCRILAQIVYYVYAAARCHRPVSFVVPTANFGNMLAGYRPFRRFPPA